MWGVVCTHMCACVCVHVYVRVHVCVYVCVLSHVESENNLLELALSFPHVDSGNQTQVIKLGDKCLYPFTISPASFKECFNDTRRE